MNESAMLTAIRCVGAEILDLRHRHGNDLVTRDKQEEAELRTLAALFHAQSDALKAASASATAAVAAARLSRDVGLLKDPAAQLEALLAEVRELDAMRPRPDPDRDRRLLLYSQSERALRNFAHIPYYMKTCWGESGFPQVELSDRLFSSLACTSIPGDLIGEVTVPWRTFAVRIPRAFQRTDAGELWWMCFDKPDWMPGWEPGFSDCATVTLFGPRVALTVTSHWHDLTSPGRTFRVEHWAEPSDEPNESQAVAVLLRVFFNIVIELMAPQHADKTSHSAAASVRRRASGIPRAWTLLLTRNVAVDLRERVRDDIQGRHRNGGAAAVQSLIRGHWKQQSHGVGRAERKYIHIEPYWRGPEDAPIAVRSHRLVDAEQGSRGTAIS